MWSFEDVVDTWGNDLRGNNNVQEVRAICLQASPHKKKNSFFFWMLASTTGKLWVKLFFKALLKVQSIPTSNSAPV